MFKLTSLMKNMAVWGVGMTAILSPSMAAAGVEPNRPNILFLLIDDQRNDTLGCAGHPIIQTPVIDSLAGEGVRFENAFVTTAICASSRASILTGLHERTHGYTFGKPALSAFHMSARRGGSLRRITRGKPIEKTQ